MVADLPVVAPGPSIYEFVCALLDPAGRLEEPGLALPDEAKVTTGRIRWAAGALDGVRRHGVGGGRSADEAAMAIELLMTACKRPSRRNLGKLYEAVVDDRVLDSVDPLIEGLVERGPDREKLHGLGRWLATTASDRGAVKIGMAILGVTGLDADLDVIRALGAHEEFTLFAAVAMVNGLVQPESELWTLAKAVDGWGRIQCVERLRDTEDRSIRSWILREGFRNSVMDEYLAYIAATTGGLLDALEAEDVDRELLTAAGQILTALMQGGPAEDIDAYEFGADAVGAFLTHMTTSAETLHDLRAVSAIRSFLSEPDGWDARTFRGWTADRREAFEARCDEIVHREAWTDRIAVGLLSDDPTEFWRAEHAARDQGMDTFAVLVERIREDPLRGPWSHAWKQADTDRAVQLATLARELLPLDQVATGPADELGMGAGWRPHAALNWTLQALRDHVGVGADLVLVGLRSPVTPNRNMSLNVLKAWPPAAWPAGARRLAEGLAQADPNEQARAFAAEVLDGTDRPETKHP